MSIFTNCGYYLPGQQPINPGVRIRTTTNTNIPTGGGTTTPVIIIIGEPDKYKCSYITTLPCPQPFSYLPERDIKRCRICDGAFNPNYGNNNPPDTDPECTFDDFQECEEACMDVLYQCPPEPPIVKWKCVTNNIEYCPEPYQTTIKTLDVECKPCDGVAGNPPPTDPGCFYDNKLECEMSQECKDINNECDVIIPDAYKCNETQLECYEVFGEGYIGFYYTGECEKCAPIGYIGTNPAVAYFDPECNYSSLPECQSGCTNIDNCEQVDPTQTEPEPGVVIIQTNVDPEDRYICKPGDPIMCTPPLEGIQRIPRDCIKCNVIIEVIDGQRVARYLDPVNNEPANCTSLELCELQCIDEIFVCLEPTNTGYGQVILGGGGGENPGNPGVSVLPPEARQGSILNYGSVERGNSYLNVIINDDNSLSVNTSVALEKTLMGLNQKKANKIIITNSEIAKSNITLNKENSKTQLYNKKLNFFAPTQDALKDKYSRLVSNIFYRNIFADYVSEEIYHVLNSINTNAPWNEKKILSITTDKIALSINPFLLNILNNLHDISYQKIPLATFLEVIKKHLLTGTLDEFDVKYYQTVYERQKQDPIKEYVLPQSKALIEKTALKVINENQISLSLENKVDYNARQIRRSKKLNEDINVRTKVETLEGNFVDLFVPNKGIEIEYLEDVDENLIDFEKLEFPLETGPGDGYYVPLETFTGDIVPFELETDASAAAYTPPEIRYEALKLINEDPNFYITASSLSAQHEFKQNDTGEVNLESMYFKLELSSVSNLTTNNLLVDRYSAKYIRLTSQSAIDEHCDTNGLSITRMNIDYRDPIFRYIKDRSFFEYEQNDINFKRQTLNKGIGNNTILTRNLPFGIIITPVKGSKYNPYNGMSNIDSYSNDIVVRTISMTPAIDDLSDELKVNDLDEKFLYEFNSDYKVGIVEPTDAQALTYRFYASSTKFSDTFITPTLETYSNSSTVSMPSSNGISYLIKDVLDNIITNYNPTQISWYDVLRRMPIHRFGELLYNSNNTILTQLSEGLRGGVLIKNVLNRPEDDTDEILPDDSMVVVKLENR